MRYAVRAQSVTLPNIIEELQGLGITVFAIGHVTKESELAGPKARG